MSYYQENHKELSKFVNVEVNSNVNGLISELDFETKFERFEPTLPDEAYEFWTVSRYLADKLRDHGEAIADFGSCYVWARTTTGQAIALDGVITEIHKEIMA